MTEENKQLAPAQEAKISALIDPKKHNLHKVHREVDKHVEEALKYLASVLKDQNADINQKMKAAKDISEFKLKVADAQNREWLQRLVVQHKIDSSIAPKQLKNVEGESEEEEDDTPVYVNDVIIEVGNVKNL